MSVRNMSEIQMIGTNDDNEQIMSNITRDHVRFPILRQKSKQFCISYSKILMRFTWIILLISCLLTIGLTIGFFFGMTVQPFNQTYFLVKNGKTSKNIQRIEQLYGHDKDFRVHQQMDLYPALDVIIKRKDSSNMLNNEVIDEIHSLDHQIRFIRVFNPEKTQQLNYSSLCAFVNHACMVDGNYLLSSKFRQDALQLPYIPTGIYIDSSTGENGIDTFIFGKNYQVINVTSSDADYQDDEEEDDEPTPVVFTQIVSHVSVFRLRYALNISNDRMRALSIDWEKAVLHYLTEQFQSNLISVFPSTSTAITDTINKQAHNEGPFMAITLLIFLIFVCFAISIQGNSQTSVGYLSVCGIVSLMLSTGATFGILAIFRIDIIEPMALIIFVVAIVDCMRISIVCGEYHRILRKHLPKPPSTKIDIHKILPPILTSTRPYFLSSSIILSLVYLIISLYSPMSCMRSLGFTLIIYLCVNYFTHCTFFSSCLVLNLKRMESRRHCLTCRLLPNDYHSVRSTRKSIFQKPRKYIAKIHPQLKTFINTLLILLSLILVGITLWFTLAIDTRLFEDRFLPKNATSLRTYMKSQADDYAVGPVIMFVIPQMVNYQNKQNQLAVRRIVKQCMNESTSSAFHLLWLDHESIPTILTGKDPMKFRITPYSQNDLIVVEDKNRSMIHASRFYCQYKSFTGNRKDLQVMNNLYDHAEKSGLPSVFPFSIIFSHYESLDEIRFEVYLLILLMTSSTFLLTGLIFFSLIKSLQLVLHLLILLTGCLTCLYLFNQLSFNFANALWLYIMPIIYLDTFIHTTFNRRQSKWQYNRVILSLIISLIILSFFPIETYIYIFIRNSLLYQSVITLGLINIFLPAWNAILRRCLKKKKKKKDKRTRMNEFDNVPRMECENLVHESNGNANKTI